MLRHECWRTIHVSAGGAAPFMMQRPVGEAAPSITLSATLHRRWWRLKLERFRKHTWRKTAPANSQPCAGRRLKEAGTARRVKQKLNAEPRG